jgi:cytidylate kinase
MLSGSAILLKMLKDFSMKTYAGHTKLMLSFVGALFILPSCGDSSKKDQGSGATGAAEILMTINGKPVITVADFEADYEQNLEQQPQLKSFAAFMPDFKLTIFSNLAAQKLIEHWAVNNKVVDKPEYKADRKQLLDRIDRALATKYFQAEHPIAVTDVEVKKFYDDNKDTVYAMSPSGVTASGIVFDKEASAKDFLAKVQQPGATFNKVAKEMKLVTRAFGRVNDQNQTIDQTLKGKILAVKKFPSVQLFNADKAFWVVQVTGREEAKYYPFEQAKQDAHDRLTTERMTEMFNIELEKLKKEYQVVEYKGYFEAKKDEAQKVATAETSKDSADAVAVADTAPRTV